MLSKTIIGAVAGTTLLATLGSLVIVLQLVNEINQIHEQSLNDLNDFKDLANSAWHEMLTDPIIHKGRNEARQRRSYASYAPPPASYATGPQQCNCGKQPNNCPCGPP
ncbi:hypothetical protein WR25_25206 [Diploscapter pachys]|uniref:Nematode cuticle collagen N-terminal domain-containing protein n=1 Tax=Diploscapter pachys TaxID=2018661 RepID=A0A2A2LFG8_9BILA|nr:hypothetical protein WR25_25206 [Diploscapter pachys]